MTRELREQRQLPRQHADAGPPLGVFDLDGGRAVVNFRARQLLLQEQPAKLGGRAFDLLAVLIQHRDRVVPKPELMDLVWPGLVVEENNLQVHVMALRKLLGAQAIVTVPGRGYRLALAARARGGEPEPHRPAQPAEGSGERASLQLAAREGLICRQPLLDAVSRAVADGARLITLTGPGGSGKTRLALHATARLAPQMPDGAYVVLLAPVRDAQHFPAAVAAALGLQEGGAESIGSLVHGYLRPRRVLLTLDNLEHLSAVAGQVRALLDAAPGLVLLATSRVLLRLSGEIEVKVPPLPLPRGDTPEQLTDSPAFRLFAERAEQVGRPLRPGDADGPAAAQICRRLDGLPLALELAAARLRTLTPVALAARLHKSLPLLHGGPAEAAQRQQTLRDTIAWSHDLLDADQRRLFRRLGAFAGGWSLEAAEALDAVGAAPARATLAGLEGLLEHNLVQRLDDIEDMPRFGMLETIREFAREQLDLSGETDAVLERHAEHGLELALKGERALTSGDRMPWLTLLRAETNNLRQALRWWTRERPDTRRALALAGAMTWLWYFEGAYREGLMAIEAALALPGADACDGERAAALSGAARLASFAGDMVRAHACAQQSIELWRKLGDARGLGFALLHDGVPALFILGRETAVELLRECAGVFAEAGDEWGVAMATVYQGVVLAALPGTEEAASPLLAEGHARCVALGDEWAASTCAGYMGVVAMRNGDFAQARRRFTRILDSARETGDRFRIGRGAHFLGELELREQRFGPALALLAEALALVVEQGRIGDFPLVACAAAQALVGLGEYVEATRLLAAGARPTGLKSSLPPDDPRLVQAATARCREALTEAAFEAAWAEGELLAPQGAVRRVAALAEREAAGPH